MPKPLNYKAIILVIFGIFFILRVWGIHFGLPYDGIHPTENFSILQSIAYRDTGNFRPLDFQHPCLFQYILTFLSFLLSLPTKDYTSFYLLGRMISCLASFLSLYFLYGLSKKIFNSRGLGLLSACFLGFNLLAVKYAHYATPDSLSLVFMVLGLIFCFKITEDAGLKNYLGAGLFCGLSIAGKFSGAITLVFLILAHLLSAKDKRAHGGRNLILSLCVASIAFFVLSPYHLFYLREAMRDFAKYFTEKGYFAGGSSFIRGLLNYLFILLPDTLGLFGMLFAALGLAFMFLKDKKGALLLFIPALAYLLVVSRDQGTLQNLLPLLPVFSILASYSFLWFKERNVARVFPVLCVILSLLPCLIQSVVFDYFILQKDTRILAQDWLMKNVKERSRIGFERYTPLDLNYAANSASREKFDAVYFIPSLGTSPASFYKQSGYDYIVTSNFRRDSYIFYCRKQRICAEANNYSTFDAQFKKVAVFAPAGIFKLAGISPPWGTWPHNPQVEIYKVN